MNDNAILQKTKQTFVVIGRYKLSFVEELKFYLNKQYAQFTNEIVFINSFEDVEDVNDLYIKVYESQPMAVFFQILANDEDTMSYKLIDLIRNNPDLDCSSLVGLTDDLSSELNTKMLVAGLDLVFEKGEPVKDLMTNVFSLRHDSRSYKNQYAIADVEKKKLSKRLIMRAHSPIVSLNEKLVTLETNFELQPGAKERIYNAGFFTKELGVSAELQHLDSDDKNRYYNKDYVSFFKLIYCNDARLEEEFKDMLEMMPKRTVEAMNEDDFQRQKITLKKNLDKKAMIKIKNWLKKNVFGNSPKKNRVLIIDSKMTYFKEFNELGKLESEENVSIRAITHLKNADKELKKFMPDIIIYNFDEGTRKTADRAYVKNGATTLARVINAIKRNKLDETVLVGFSCQFTIESIKESSGFQKIIGTPDKLNLEMISKFVNLYNKKQKIKEQYQDKSKELMTHYFDKYDRKHYVEFARSCKIMRFSENMIELECDQKLPYYTPFKVTNPWNVWLTLVPDNIVENRKNTGYYRYKALIHSLNESQREKIRREVNKIYFAGIEAVNQKHNVDFLLNKIKYVQDQMIDNYYNKTSLDSITEKEFDEIAGANENLFKMRNTIETELRENFPDGVMRMDEMMEKFKIHLNNVKQELARKIIEEEKLKTDEPNSGNVA